MKPEEKNKEELKKNNIEAENNRLSEKEKGVFSEKEKIEISDEEKIKELEDKLVRSLAEMENQRRRFEKEKEDAFEFGGFTFAKESLSLIDNLERAKISLKNDEILKKHDSLKKILDVFEVIEKNLLSVFKKNGIEPIKSLNKKFDPNFHQAMLEIEDKNKESGIVVQEIQKGYTMKEMLLRPSLVGVTKKTDKNKKDPKKGT
jgi:molecular chaperone GrpE